MARTWGAAERRGWRKYQATVAIRKPGRSKTVRRMTYQCHLDVMLDGYTQAAENRPRILSLVQVLLEEPFAEDAEGRLPVAVST